MSADVKVKSWKQIVHVIAPCGDRWVSNRNDPSRLAEALELGLTHTKDCDLCINRATEEPDYEAYDRPARAYGFEIGRGKPLTEVIEDMSDDNPFIDPDWRDNVVS